MPAAVQKSSTTSLGSRSSLKSESIRHSARPATVNGVRQIPIDRLPRPPFRLAVSSFGGFQTPAAQHLPAPFTCKPASENLHTSGRQLVCLPCPLWSRQKRSSGMAADTTMTLSLRCTSRRTPPKRARRRKAIAPIPVCDLGSI